MVTAKSKQLLTWTLLLTCAIGSYAQKTFGADTNTNWRARFKISEDFPKFIVPGHESEMESLRALHWLHYQTAEGATTASLWDEWITGPFIWPALTNDRARTVVQQALDHRHMDAEGYVATHNWPASGDTGTSSISYDLSWVFPTWINGSGGFGWHFSFKNTGGEGVWRPRDLTPTNGWTFTGARNDGLGDEGWKITLTEPNATASAPPRDIDSRQSPFVQLRWFALNLTNAQPFLEWTTKSEPQFSSDKRFYFDPARGTNRNSSMVPVFKHPKWTNTITQLRVNFGNANTNIPVTIQALFTQYDTRHTINNPNFVRGCIQYFYWTRDLNFLRRNINRMRIALRFDLDELKALKRGYIFTPWVGHEGRSGVRRQPDGSKQIISGEGIGANYWDILPFGYKDAYATIHYYDAVRKMSALEREILAHPEWNILGGALKLDSDMLDRHAAHVEDEGNRIFWNPETRRFISAIDKDGQGHDYGFTFLNCDAIYYDFATPEHAAEIESWLHGERVVEGDTAQGADIYHWRFGPRSTTKRNIDYYGWFWSAPESIPFGAQVQDGGAVLGWSYHDLMARLKTRGADDAWKRLQEILSWFEEAQAAGGYRAYYNGTREGSMQGDNIAGGLGLDKEFFESLLVPQIMLNGFLGFSPASDGCRIDPQLPKDWPELTVDRIHLHNLILKIKTTRDTIEIWKEGQTDVPFFVQLPKTNWQASYLSADGESSKEKAEPRKSDGAVEFHWNKTSRVRFSVTK